MKKRRLVLGLCFLLIVSVCVSGALRSRRVPEAVSNPPNAIVVFNPKNAAGVHTIPFLFRGIIWISSSFGKKNVWSVLDSGSVIASCPEDFGGAGVLWSDYKAPFQTGVPSLRPASLHVLTQVKVPNCTLQNCPVIEYPRFAGETDPDVDAIIPLSVFSQFTVMIDYRRSQLTIFEKRLSPDTVRLPNPEDNLENPVWLPLILVTYKGWGPYPVVQGVVNGVNMNCVLDTASPYAIWVTNRKLFSAIRTSRTSSVPPIRQDAAWSFGQLHGNGPLMVDPRDEQIGIDASIGNAVLCDYRITIDYPNRRVCFERYLTP